MKILYTGSTEGKVGFNDRKVSILTCGIDTFCRSWCAGEDWGNLVNFFTYKDGVVKKEEVTIEDRTGYYVSVLKSKPFYLLLDVTNM